MVIKTKIRYNIVEKDGEKESVSVFIGRENFVATRDNQQFGRLVQYLTSTKDPDETYVRDLLDVSKSIQKNFTSLSERVAIRNGKVYLDGDEQYDALSNAIVNFYIAGNDDFRPLVLFMEKIATNPQQHSREQLFQFLAKHRFPICDDGDFIAYKQVGGADFLSQHSGNAIVNGVPFTNSKIPNQPGTIIEMPRNEVAGKPTEACSTGLHVANWRYAKTFMTGGKLLRVKVNPRDVVSVPHDSSHEKVRCCRYKVVDVVTAEDTSALFVTSDKLAKYVPPAPPASPAPEAEKPAEKPKRQPSAGKKPAPKAPAKPEPKPMTYPKYYEQFSKEQFESLDMEELRFIYKEFELKPPTPRTKAALVAAVLKQAKVRLRTW